MSVSTVPHIPKVHYPSSDGKPMAESDFQRGPLMYAVEALRIHFQQQPDVYVSGNLFIYYEEGNPEAVVAPDVFVVRGVPNRDRSSYFVWKEQRPPEFVLEITSKSTRGEDQGVKRGVYAYLGVREYFQFDPTGDYLRPPLRGARLEKDAYIEMGPVVSDGMLSIHSHVLGLDLRVEHDLLRFFEPSSGRKLMSHAEAEQAWRAAELAQHAAELAQHAAELAQHAAERAQHAAERAQHVAEERAGREAEAREAAERRVAELEARLKATGSEGPSV
jgi:Uma2 family endonuclease